MATSLEKLMGKLIESQIKTNESLETLTNKIDGLIKDKGSEKTEYSSTTHIDIRSMNLEPERVTKKFRIMYVMNKPLYPDKNNSSPDMGFVSDTKGTRNFDSREEAEEYIKNHKELIDPIITEIFI